MKKITAIFLIIFMICFDVSANGSSSKENNAELILRDLGFVQSTGDSGEAISRAEFADILIKMLNSEISASNNNFSDVGLWHEYYNSLSAAYSLGIISGGVVRPDDGVTYHEAVKMTVCALGYEVQALNMGGYPVGYLTVAATNGITKGVEVPKGGITRAAAYRMVYNAISVDLLEATSIGGNLTYKTTSGNNVLTRYHNIFKGVGLVEGVHGLSLFQNSRIPENMVLIEGKMYYANRSGLNELVGHTAEFYYDAAEDAIVSIRSENNDVITIDAENIEGFSGMRLNYTDGDGKENYAQLSIAANIIYNGVAIDYFDENYFLDGQGEIKLIDNRSDGVYDTVFLNITEDYVVKTVDAAEGMLYDLYDSGKSLYMDVSDPEYTISFTDEFGNIMFLEELVKYDVVSVVKSLDEKVINAYYSNSEVIGTVEGISKSDGDLNITINGIEYKTTPAFAANETIKIGDNGVFALNINKNIASINRDGDDKILFGFMINGMESAGLDKDYQFKIFDEKGEMVILSSAAYITVDGYSVTGENALQRLSKNGDFVPQLVRYGLNSEGKINYIDTKEKTDAEGASAMERQYSCYFDAEDREKTPELLEYRTTGIFGAKVPTGGKTRVFVVPWNLTNASDDDFGVYSMSYFRNTITYSIDAYKTDADAHLADAVVVRPRESEVKPVTVDTPISVVIRQSLVLDEWGEAVTKIYCYTSGKVVESLVKNERVLEIPSLSDPSEKHNLEPGDVIKYDLDDFGNMSSIELIYERAGDVFKYPNDENAAAKNHIARVMRGEVYSLSAGNMMLHKGEIGGSGTVLTLDQLESHTLRVYNIYVYDKKEEDDPVRLGTAADIVDYRTTGAGSKLILYSRYANNGAIVVYK